MFENRQRLQEEISQSINGWHKKTITELEKNHGLNLNAFYNNVDRKEALTKINAELQNNIGLTLHSIYPRLYIESESNDFSQLSLFEPVFYISKLSKFLRADLTFEEQLLFYKNEFDAYLKRFFFLGKLDFELAIFLYTYINGYGAIKKHLSAERWNDLLEMLEDCSNKGYGIQNANWSMKYSSNFVNANNDKKDVWLAGFKHKSSPSMNFYYGPLTFFKFDNLDITELLIDKNLLSDYLDTYNSSENIIRELRGLPRVGEGWISETILFYMLKKYFGNSTSILHHGKPKWLGRQHFDIYMPEYNIAIEYQGEQHYQPIDFFGGKESFKANKLRDERKKSIAKENNCHLICVDKGYSDSNLISEIEFHINKNKSSL
ncbi:MAG: hypothetical protein A3F91_08355 [Flavobacteria bacterium RIFCSPLOWO2_12_FULL_35_11]|nr:MAG: hypothetical protein A3F91_08355 [Flavobacteria bacterium RIFCSPLOWO2_12_FULL_35_11]